MLIEENLFGEYLRNLTIRKINKYVKFNSNFDYAIPRQKNIYNFLKSNKKLMNKYNKELNETGQKLANLSDGEVKQTIAENNKLDIITRCINRESNNITLDKFVNLSNLNSDIYKVIEIKKQHHCIIDMISYIVSINDNILVTQSDIRSKLGGILTELMNDTTKMKTIWNSLKLANKTNLLQLFKTQSVGDIVNIAEYYFTELDLILLALAYDFGLILVSNKFSFTTFKMIKVNPEKEKVVVLIMDDYKTFKIKDNTDFNSIPRFGILQKYNMIFINKESFLNELNENENENENKVLVINNVFEMLKTIDAHFNKIKKMETVMHLSK